MRLKLPSGALIATAALLIGSGCAGEAGSEDDVAATQDTIAPTAGTETVESDSVMVMWNGASVAAPKLPCKSADLTVSEPAQSTAARTITHPQGHTLEIPAGGISQPRAFSIRQMPSPHLKVKLAPPTRFATNTYARLTVDYTRCGIATDQKVILAMEDSVSTIPAVVPATRSASPAQTVTVDLEHFSTYVLADGGPFLP